MLELDEEVAGKLSHTKCQVTTELFCAELRRSLINMDRTLWYKLNKDPTGTCVLGIGTDWADRTHVLQLDMTHWKTN